MPLRTAQRDDRLVDDRLTTPSARVASDEQRIETRLAEVVELIFGRWRGALLVRDSASLGAYADEHTDHEPLDDARERELLPLPVVAADTVIGLSVHAPTAVARGACAPPCAIRAVRFEDPQQQKNDALELYCERLPKQPEADAPAPAAEAVPPGADEQPAGGEN